jgi:hypothetical protein
MLGWVEIKKKKKLALAQKLNSFLLSLAPTVRVRVPWPARSQSVARKIVTFPVVIRARNWMKRARNVNNGAQVTPSHCIFALFTYSLLPLLLLLLQHAAAAR